MGIVNVTPDSFSDGGKYNTAEKAVEHAKRLISEGADILDIGGESTRPGHEPVPAEEELRRVVPVIEALKRESLGVPISVDTYKASVAEAALKAGAHIINDVWGGKAEPDILKVSARYGAPVMLMHNRFDMNYGPDFVRDVLDDLRESVKHAVAAGVPQEHILLDPGLGFVKNYEHNLLLMNRLRELVALGYPVVLGTSRKRFIRETLDGASPDDVLEGTVATTVLGIAHGVHIVRVHDVRANKRAARVADAIVRAGEGGLTHHVTV
ncbi:dihydropteroate synthase [Paenibacillus thermotolerans]|uniref:dihydropteroate synthase n=1 Tax=Paenibacillus thermotolerans TaxID=3027807 RepID=UPI002368C233|nr:MULTISPECIES: dihydropteroate synthase [unclassified Paenibacillus]